MAQVNFDQISTNSNNNDFRVGFFNLKNDGDEAIVRIMHDDVSSFDIVTTHQIRVGDKYRRINCIRDPREPMENCPLCKSGSKIQQRIYLHLIQYTMNENNQIVAQPKVWERAASYAITIKNLMDEYGPLSDSIFKIRRNGKAGAMDTTYSIMYGNPNMYKPEYYPKDMEAFKDYKAVGTTVLDKSFEDIAAFLADGEFPSTQNQQTATPTVNPAPVTAPIPSYNPPSVPVPNTALQQPYSNIGTIPTADSPIQRPVRYY